MPEARTTQAHDLMWRFAERTGLTGHRPAHRYLWTDAFAVCNFLALWHATGDNDYRDLALGLVDQVHHTLGRHRPDSERTGWLSGLDEAHGEAHPTRGGLRIGKPLPERRADDLLDHHLEWERDGQYFHYLTKWMHALDQVARAIDSRTHHRWARELAEVAWRAFVHQEGLRPRMHWKMSVDLRRSLVPSMGLHDPLDGLLTCLELEATGTQFRIHVPMLAEAVESFAAIVSGTELATSDPLGIGGLFADVSRINQLGRPVELRAQVERAARTGLRQYLAASELDAPAATRLAFRELGLAIGLAGDTSPTAHETRNEIEEFWLVDVHRRSRSWHEHQDINDVMLATCLMPAGFLVLHPRERGHRMVHLEPEQPAH